MKPIDADNQDRDRIIAEIKRKMKAELCMKLKLMDTTIKGVSDSPEYHDAQLYNAGIRTAMEVLDAYKEEHSLCDSEGSEIQNSSEEVFIDSEDDAVENCEHYLMGACRIMGTCSDDNRAYCPF